MELLKFFAPFLNSLILLNVRDVQEAISHRSQDGVEGWEISFGSRIADSVWSRLRG